MLYPERRRLFRQCMPSGSELRRTLVIVQLARAERLSMAAKLSVNLNAARAAAWRRRH